MRKKKYLYQIYKITNIINNKVYIGLTVQGAKKRYLHHLYEARSNSTFPIHNSIRKYGEDKFRLEVIETVNTHEELKELEKFYISLYDSNNRQLGYNLTAGGDGTLGRFHSEETKAKIREKAINRIPKESTKARMSESHCSIEALGLPPRKEIKVFCIKTNIYKIYRSLTRASKDLNIAKETILKYININNGIYKDYIFELTAA